MIKIIILFIFNKFANAFLFFLGNTPKSRYSRAVVNPNASARKPISRHSHVYPVIPTKVGIQDAKSQETVLPDKFPHRQT
ncbi:hypothetical protein GWC85_07795 [Neisseria meningitidis]|nr:hypothetical protein [Neisseria meningitidis]